jgi:hypothetical protein
MTENNDEARLAAMREVQRLAEAVEAAARSEELTREALAIQRRAKREAKDGKK